MNTPKPCSHCKHLYADCIYEDDPTYMAECEVIGTEPKPKWGDKDCPRFKAYDQDEQDHLHCISRETIMEKCTISMGSKTLKLTFIPRVGESVVDEEGLEFIVTKVSYYTKHLIRGLYQGIVHAETEEIDNLRAEVKRLENLLPDLANDNICATCEYHGKEALKLAMDTKQ